MKMPEFKDNFVDEEQVLKNRALMRMKTLEKAMFEKMVVNDGYTHRNSVMIYSDADEVVPFVPPEIVDEANE